MQSGQQRRMLDMERTLVIIKPCALQKEKCAEHYSHLVGKSFYPIGDYFEYDSPMFDYLYASDEV